MKLPPHIVWPGVVVGLLGLSVTMVTITVVAATSDPSFAVVDDYYERGLNWDAQVAQNKKNAELGWTAAVEVGEPDALRQRPLIVTLTDADGAPIENAQFSASIFRYAAANLVEQLDLAAADQPGRYLATADIKHEGKWRVNLEVRAKGELFTSEQTIELDWD